MFVQEIKDYTISLDAMRDYSEYIEPLVWEKLKKQSEEEIIKIINFKNVFDKLKELPTDASDEDKEKVIQEISAYFVNDIKIQYGEESWELIAQGEDVRRIENVSTNMNNITKQVELMHKSTLINLVSCAECFLGDIIKRYFSLYKGEVDGKLIEEKEKVYTIHELEEFSSIEEAKAYIIDKKIENLLRGSFEDWIKFLKQKLGLSIGYIDKDYDTLVEIFQRRNLFIHNKGIINRIYLSNVKESKAYSNTLGERIILDGEYLEEAIFYLEKNLILIALELWKKREKNDTTRSEFSVKVAEKYMMQENWKMLESLTTFILNDKAISDANLKVSQINYWLSQKRLGKINKEKVQKYDFSGSSMVYIICQMALLDDTKKAIELIERALDTSQITIEAVFEWPVLQEVRGTKEFQEMLIKRNISIPNVEQLFYPEIEVDENEL